MAGSFISIRGAREHNLQGIDVDIPRDKLVVITGLSGSGKSTLAFDTLYAEGQRKYVESLSAYARQFLEQLQKPDIESIEGLPPTIAIEQRSTSHNPRSTVATTTEIYDYLRLLFARIGQPRCWHRDEEGKVCDRPITGQSATQIVDAILSLPAGSRLMILSPLIRGKKGQHKEVFDAMIRQGFVRCRVNGQLLDLRDNKAVAAAFKAMGRYETHYIEAVVDRIVISPSSSKESAEQSSGQNKSIRSRVADSVELALKISGGLVLVSVEQGGGGAAAASVLTLPGQANWSDTLYSENFACPLHPECSLEDLEPRLFSFNSPYGACPSCHGLGTIMEFDPELVVADDQASLSGGAIAAWRHQGKNMNIWYARILRRFCRDFGISPDQPYKSIPAAIRKILLYGTTSRDEAKYQQHFEGVLPNLQRRWENTESEFVKAKLQQFFSEAPCETCAGARLKPQALHVYIYAQQDGPDTKTSQPIRVNIHDVTGMTIERAVQFFSSLQLSAEQRSIAAPILKEVTARLGFMLNVGLGYLSLNRTTGSLSGGEGQRIRLATQVGSGLVGCCYVLDEPTIGLHQRDNDRLIATLRKLTDIGNTVVVVEHDEDTIRAADHILDIGPGPGRHGGRIVAQGGIADILACPESITGQYLSGQLSIPIPAQRRNMDHSRAVVVRGARENNLKSIDVTFPLGGIICVTGVSGSGKSTLVNQILLRAARRQLLGSRDKPGAHDSIQGLKAVDRIIEVDQTPIGRTPRSNPATYVGLFDHIRSLFSQTKEARIRGYKPGRFSCNVKGGRCEACQGQGTKRIEMHFLPDVYVQCETCRGTRYNRETLEVHYKGKSIAEVLAMTVEESLGFFENFPIPHQLLAALNDVGLSYVQLGQSSTTLSGGEAQRVKLATELGKRPAGHTLYLLDEPTTGLHFADINRLVQVLHRLADQGHTIIVIEHNLDVIKCADWIIDLGPEGGERGGQVVFAGPPERIIDHAPSYTGQHLKRHLTAQTCLV